MREILFKGIRQHGEGWVLGDLIQSCNTDSKWILPISESDLTQVIEVMPETISQYIGIKDKVGSRIFENSILKGQFGTGIGGKSTKYKAFNFSISFNEHLQKFCLNMPKGYGQYRFHPYLKECIVIGNIFDHPELL